MLLSETLLLAFVVVGLLGSAEFLLMRSVRRARASFQWMITEEDTLPLLDSAKLDAFVASSFSPALGWEPVPGSTGQDQGPDSVSAFMIGHEGARAAPPGAPAPTVAAFGDSYAFCRQVNDDETWAAVLGREGGVGVLNFGVGNYGVDQALLRYLARRGDLGEDIHTVIAVFVPETICRVQSVWKHWMEFGNTFGFKPRFFIQDGRMQLFKNPVRKRSDYDRLEEIVESLSDIDPFRDRRFRRLQFRTPYLFALLRAPIRHLSVLSTVLLGRERGSVGTLRREAFDKAFARVMRDNVRDAHREYEDPESVALLSAILERFQGEVEADGRRFVTCVIPQMLDLATPRRAHRTYGAYFRSLGEHMDVIDLTPDLRRHPPEEIYVHDRFGGHLSVRGNELVALRLAEVLR